MKVVVFSMAAAVDMRFRDAIRVGAKYALPFISSEDRYYGFFGLERFGCLQVPGQSCHPLKRLSRAVAVRMSIPGDPAAQGCL